MFVDSGAVLVPIEVPEAVNALPVTPPPDPTTIAPPLDAVPAVSVTAPVPPATGPFRVIELLGPPAIKVTPVPLAPLTMREPFVVWTLTAPPCAVAARVRAPA